MSRLAGGGDPDTGSGGEAGSFCSQAMDSSSSDFVNVCTNRSVFCDDSRSPSDDGRRKPHARRLTGSPLAYPKAETDVKTASRSGAGKYLELAEVAKVERRASRPPTCVSLQRKKSRRD